MLTVLYFSSFVPPTSWQIHATLVKSRMRSNIERKPEEASRAHSKDISEAGLVNPLPYITAQPNRAL